MGLARDAAFALAGLVAGILLATSTIPPPMTAATASALFQALNPLPDVEGTSASNNRSNGGGFHVNPIFAVMRMKLDQLFNVLLEGVQDNRSGLVVEVGSFDAVQAKYAIEQGYPVVIVEPSPVNLLKVKSMLAPFPKDSYELHEKAASSVRGKVNFYAGKESGDFVSFDGSIPVGERETFSAKDMTTVEALPLDDILGPDRRVFLLKVDTQGHDYEVLRGAEKLFSERRVSIAVFEFHPARLQQPSTAAADMLMLLDRYGYDVMSTTVHPQRSPRRNDRYVSSGQSAAAFIASMSLDAPLKIPNRTLEKFGEWTDIVAVCRTCVGAKMFGSRLRPTPLS